MLRNYFSATGNHGNSFADQQGWIQRSAIYFVLKHSETVYSSIFVRIKSGINAPVPKEMVPVPDLSNSWKATMKRVSGAHNTDSNARNSWNEISLQRCVGMREREKKVQLFKHIIKRLKTLKWNKDEII